MNAVQAYVDAYAADHKDRTAFKVCVFAGRGVHEFKLDDTMSRTVRDVAHLEKQLAQAKEKLAALREGDSKKRRVSEE